MGIREDTYRSFSSIIWKEWRNVDLAGKVLGIEGMLMGILSMLIAWVVLISDMIPDDMILLSILPLISGIVLGIIGLVVERKEFSTGRVLSLGAVMLNVYVIIKVAIAMLLLALMIGVLWANAGTILSRLAQAISDATRGLH